MGGIPLNSDGYGRTCYLDRYVVWRTVGVIVSKLIWESGHCTEIWRLGGDINAGGSSWGVSAYFGGSPEILKEEILEGLYKRSKGSPASLLLQIQPWFAGHNSTCVTDAGYQKNGDQPANKPQTFRKPRSWLEDNVAMDTGIGKWRPRTGLASDVCFVPW